MVDNTLVPWSLDEKIEPPGTKSLYSLNSTVSNQGITSKLVNPASITATCMPFPSYPALVMFVALCIWNCSRVIPYRLYAALSGLHLSVSSSLGRGPSRCGRSLPFQTYFTESTNERDSTPLIAKLSFISTTRVENHLLYDTTLPPTCSTKLK